MEKWIYLNDEKSKYKISSDGYVISTKYNGKEGVVRQLKHSHDRDGYCIITLNHKGKKYTRKIHRLVAEAFIPNPKGYPEVNHCDGDKDNNCDDNLEWCDTTANIHHALNNDLRYRINAEESIEEVCALLSTNDYSISEISKITGVSKPTIRRIKNGKRWKTIGDKYDFSNFNKSSYVKGEDNKMSRITESDAHQICQMLESGKCPTEISKSLNISRGLIYHIKYRKTWIAVSSQYNF